MAKPRLLFLLPLLVLMLAPTSYAAQVVNFSSAFARGKGSPTVEQKRFPGVAGPATIEVVNGGLGDTATEKVSSAVVRVNGAVIFDTANFSQNVLKLTKQVVLNEGENNLNVLLNGKPGGTVAIRVTQEVAAEGAAIVGSSGGEIVVADINSPIYGTRCVVPTMALSKDEVITIKVAEEYIGGQQGGVGSVVDFGPSGTVFSVPVTITLPYNDAEIREKQIVSEDLLRIYHYKEDANVWENVTGSYVDPANGSISVKVNHFSKYQINGDKLYDINKGAISDIKENILLIHGLQLTNSGYADDPADVFGNLPTFLSDNYRVWYLSYDSQSGISSNGNNLSQVIDKIKQKTGSGMVNIIAHSEGGLVARSYIQGSTYAGNVTKLIQLGTPNHGTDYVNTVCDRLIDSAHDILTVLTCTYVSSLTSVQEMSNPNSTFFRSINDPMTMPQNAVIYSIYSGDLPSPNEDTPGDRVVTKKSSELSDFQEFPGIHNIELNEKLYHTTLLGANGIASIISSEKYPACDSRYTCDHPVWREINSILSNDKIVVTVKKTGAGTVALTPGGINCGSVCTGSIGSSPEFGIFMLADPGWQIEKFDFGCNYNIDTPFGTPSFQCMILEQLVKLKWLQNRDIGIYDSVAYSISTNWDDTPSYLYDINVTFKYVGP